MSTPLSPVKRAAVKSVADAMGLPADAFAATAPPKPDLGDIAVGLFPAAKAGKGAPPALAAQIVAAFQPTEWLTAAKAAGPYVNFTVNRAALFAHLQNALACGDMFQGSPGKGTTVCIDYSSPNIAKHLAYHHIRSTVIGQALVNIHRALGARVVGINHLGDWGTTHGMLLCALERWHDPRVRLTISVLNDLYVRFRAEMEKDPNLEQVGRTWFLRLEAGEPEARAMWRQIREVSLAEFQKVYDMLGVAFDEIRGESAYESDMPGVIDMLKAKGLTSVSEGALVVDLTELNVPPLLLRKQDGATLYATRDLAAAQYRKTTHQHDRSLYVVDKGQGLHFKQLFATLAKAGFAWASELEHVTFGLVRLGGKKTGTRTGNVILLREVLTEAETRVLVKMQDGGGGGELTDEEREKVARDVGIGAVVFANLQTQRDKDMDFDWDDILAFEGDAGPAAQYAHARIASILRRSGDRGPVQPGDLDTLTQPEEWALAKLLTELGDETARAAVANEPHIVARYVLDVCGAFSRWYALGNQDPSKKVLVDDPATTRARLFLARASQEVLAKGLGLLGLAAPERM